MCTVDGEVLDVVGVGDVGITSEQGRADFAISYTYFNVGEKPDLYEIS